MMIASRSRSIAATPESATSSVKVGKIIRKLARRMKRVSTMRPR
jgi:hypothetical protein